MINRKIFGAFFICPLRSMAIADEGRLAELDHSIPTGVGRVTGSSPISFQVNKASLIKIKIFDVSMENFEQASCYILYSSILDRYYIGSTSMEPQARLRRHLSNHKGFTSKAKDWIIVYTELFDTIGLARKREYQIKRWKSRKKVEQLIHSNS
ncbi:MAG: GIY-YIG nuclease family protein [Bacteroidota bacterium]